MDAWKLEHKHYLPPSLWSSPDILETNASMPLGFALSSSHSDPETLYIPFLLRLTRIQAFPWSLILVIDLNSSNDNPTIPSNPHTSIAHTGVYCFSNCSSSRRFSAKYVNCHGDSRLDECLIWNAPRSIRNESILPLVIIGPMLSGFAAATISWRITAPWW